MRYYNMLEAVDELAEALFDVRLKNGGEVSDDPSLLPLAQALTNLMMAAEHTKGEMEATRFEGSCLHGSPDSSSWGDYDYDHDYDDGNWDYLP